MLKNLTERLADPAAQKDMRMARGLGTISLLTTEIGMVMALQPESNPVHAGVVLGIAGYVGYEAIDYLRGAFKATRQS